MSSKVGGSIPYRYQHNQYNDRVIIGAALVSLVMGPGAMCFAAPNPRALLRNFEEGAVVVGGWNYYGIWVQLINLFKVQWFSRTPHLPSRWYRREYKSSFDPEICVPPPPLPLLFEGPRSGRGEGGFARVLKRFWTSTSVVCACVCTWCPGPALACPWEMMRVASRSKRRDTQVTDM